MKIPLNKEVANTTIEVNEKKKAILKKMFGNVPSRFDLNKVREWEKHERED